MRGDQERLYAFPTVVAAPLLQGSALPMTKLSTTFPASNGFFYQYTVRRSVENSQQGSVCGFQGLDSYYSSFGNSLKNHSWILLSHLDGSPVFCPCSHTGGWMLISHLSPGAPDFPQIPSYLVFLQHQSSIGSEKSYDFFRLIWLFLAIGYRCTLLNFYILGEFWSWNFFRVHHPL